MSDLAKATDGGPGKSQPDESAGSLVVRRALGLGGLLFHFHKTTDKKLGSEVTVSRERKTTNSHVRS